jgi:PTS system ascorbate-specific IIA component
MVGILVIGHAPLASAMATCVEHVYACDPEVSRAHVRVLDVVAGSDFDATLERARSLLAEIEGDGGALVLTDAFGATPGNIAARLSVPGRIAVIAGVNVPMLLRAVCYRSGALADVAEKALAGGQQGMVQIVATPVQNQAFSPLGNDQQRLHHQQ